MKLCVHERPTLLLSILMVLLLTALPACSVLGTPRPATPTAASTFTAPAPDDSAAGVPAAGVPAAGIPAAEDTTALKKDGSGSTTVQAAETPLAGGGQAVPPCAGQPACASLLVTQSGKPSRVGFSAQGLQARAASDSPTEGTRWVIDTGTPSLDGKWVAYTSIGYEAGGPVFVQNLESGEWVNLIEQMNAHKVEGQPDFPVDLNWDVIGWFPDSQRLMIGPVDLSSVVVVDRASYAAQVIGFPGGGKGGRMFVTLAPDGSSFLFFGENAAGLQTVSLYNLASGETNVLQEVAYESAFLTNPRFSPDGMRIAYILQSGKPQEGLTYAMNLMAREGGMPMKLVEGNLSMTVPNWSPDGAYIAFTRNDAAPSLVAAPDQAPPEPQGNLWIVSVKDGTQTQVTFTGGLARSPVWAEDGKTLAFVTEAGEVNLASVDQPGQIWQAAGPSELPELTNVFFVP